MVRQGRPSKVVQERIKHEHVTLTCLMTILIQKKMIMMADDDNDEEV